MTAPLATGGPELLVLVLDARLALIRDASDTAAATAFPQVWQALGVLRAAHCALSTAHRTALFAAHARRATLLATGLRGMADWEEARQATVRFLLEPGAQDGEPLLAGALAQVLCHAQRQRSSLKEVAEGLCGGSGRAAGADLAVRCLLLSASAGQDELTMQSSGLVNCAFAAQAVGMPIDCLALGDASCALLQQASALSGGRFEALPPTSLAGRHRLSDACTAMLLFHFLPGAAARRELKAMDEVVHNYAAVCKCHAAAREIAFVCSCCLSIYCSDDLAICTTCGTRLRPDVPEAPQLRDVGHEFPPPVSQRPS